MGIVLSKLQKENSTEAVLEVLQLQIQTLEKCMISTEEQKQRLVTNFVGFTTGLYIVGLGLGYFFYCPQTVQEGMVYLVPLLLIPILIILLRRLLTWHFERKLNENGDKLAKLKEEKRILLEEVMSKETYKVALNLLERFDDEKREIRLQTALAISELKEPQPQPQPQPQLPAVQELRRSTPFPIVDDRSRSALVRFLDFVLGDGPQNRFGMICKECHAHNGMLPKEEYEYASFWCVACNVLNQARKVRPVAPRLQLEVPESPDSTKSSESFN